MIYKNIIDKYYPQNDELKQLLLKHSSDVAEKAIDIVRRHPELGADAQFVHEAAMLHDIGICRTDAPSIHCHGTDPYILHGINGGRMLRNGCANDIRGRASHDNRLSTATCLCLPETIVPRPSRNR